MSDDLIQQGMEADRIRAELHPDGFVTYCQGGEDTGHLVPFAPGMTGVEYLAAVARARAEVVAPVIEADWRNAGWKVAQLALRFGANDFGDVSGAAVEDVRRVIRDAGFVPKERDGAFTFIEVD